MESKRRDKLEIIRSILLICKKGDATKTRIVYRANLNFKTAGIYLDWLINKEIVVKNDSHFDLTVKGIACLDGLKDVIPLYADFPSGAGAAKAAP